MKQPLTQPKESVSTSPEAKPTSRELELDFIRGIAILMVVDYHVPKHLLGMPFLWLGWQHFGWAGVDMFFVLSGFLVGGLLIKEWRVRGRIDIKRFLIRRGFKIWPQYYVFLLAILLTRHRTFHELLGNFLNIQNYVGGVAHTWTLAVEEHAYLLLVALLGIAVAWRLQARTIFAIICGIAAISITRLFWVASHGGNVFTPTDTRIHGILFGVLLAMLYHYTPQRFQRLQSFWPLWIAVLFATLAAFRFLRGTWWSASAQILLADISGVAILLLLYRHRTGKHYTWVYRAIAWIGLYSYGIYLWHISVIDPTVSFSRHLPMALRAPWLLLVPPFAGIVTGVITTRLVEFPSLALRDRLFPRRIDSAVGTPAQTEAAQIFKA